MRQTFQNQDRPYQLEVFAGSKGNSYLSTFITS